MNLTSRTADGPRPPQPRVCERLRTGRSRFVRRVRHDRGPIAARSLPDSGSECMRKSEWRLPMNLHPISEGRVHRRDEYTSPWNGLRRLGTRKLVPPSFMVPMRVGMKRGLSMNLVAEFVRIPPADAEDSHFLPRERGWILFCSQPRRSVVSWCRFQPDA